MAHPTVLIVPGLRDAVPTHWQTLLEKRLRDEGRPVLSVPPLGREDLDCGRKVRAIEAVAQSVDGPMIIVAYSGGCIMVAHWAQQTKRAVHGALLAVPPDFERPMPEGYPTLAQLQAAGWLPVPRERLPSQHRRGEPQRSARRRRTLPSWRRPGAANRRPGEVGHPNPASGYGERAALTNRPPVGAAGHCVSGRATTPSGDPRCRHRPRAAACAMTDQGRAADLQPGAASGVDPARLARRCAVRRDPCAAAAVQGAVPARAAFSRAEHVAFARRFGLLRTTRGRQRSRAPRAGAHLQGRDTRHLQYENAWHCDATGASARRWVRCCAASNARRLAAT